MTFHVLFLCLESFLFILSTCQDITYSPLLGLRDFYSQRECWEATGVPGTCQWRKSYHWSPVRCWGRSIFWQASLRWRACPWMAPTELYCHVPQTLVTSPSSQSSGPVCCLHWETSEASIHVVSEILQAKNRLNLFCHDPLHLQLSNKNLGLTTFPICALIRTFLYMHWSVLRDANY